MSGEFYSFIYVEGDPNIESVELLMKPYMTIRELKYEVFHKTKIPMFLQKWLINGKTPQNDRQYLRDFISTSNTNNNNSNTFFLKREKLNLSDSFGTNRNNNRNECSISSNSNTTNRPSRNSRELVRLSSRPLICNIDTFDCPVCYTETDPGDGVILRGCLHSFCKECLQKTVEFSEEIAVPCPFLNDDYRCESFIDEREIKSLLSVESWEKYLERSVRVAQGNIENVFRCRTPNCKGWCVYEDANEFECPVCKGKNCLVCRAIHPNYTCKQYQDVATGGDEETKAEIQRMVSRGEAMYCPSPSCKIVVMKKVGCDWMQCTMCRTEICWATRGPRWGPRGRGDTNGGCGCRVNGRRCHPACQNCH